MRKVSLKVLIFASICALAALGGCLDPVNLTAFLNDDDVKGAIDNGRVKEDGVKIGINFEVGDKSPKLQWGASNTGPWNDVNGDVSITKLALPLYLKVSNASDYSANSIEWHCDNSAALTPAQGVGGTNNDTLTAGTSIFTSASPKTYNITVVGNVSGTPYGTYVFIKVDN